MLFLEIVHSIYYLRQSKAFTCSSDIHVVAKKQYIGLFNPMKCIKRYVFSTHKNVKKSTWISMISSNNNNYICSD